MMEGWLRGLWQDLGDFGEEFRDIVGDTLAWCWPILFAVMAVYALATWP